MAKRRLLHRLYPTYLVVILLCILGVAAVARRQVRAFYFERLAEDLTAKCRMAERQLAEHVASGRRDALERLTRELGDLAGVRITVIAPDGQVLSDSERDAETMENHATRPEIVRARAGEIGRSVRYSDTLRGDMVYVAAPVRGPSGVVGVVRAARSLAGVDEALSAVTRRIWLGGLAVAAVAAVLSMVVTRRIGGALRDVADAAECFARGDLAHKVPESGALEFDRLADSLNRMAASLRHQIETVNRQNREHEAVLAGMTEGVIAVDGDQRIISLNRAAARLLNADASATKGRTLPETTRNVLLQRFVGGVLAGRGPLDAEIVLHDGPERHVLVRGTVLRDAEDRDIGALIVMSDLTRVRRLENVQRDFAAAVSHELRTPVTAIQGFAETLRDGAIEDPERAAQFVDILSRQAGRLGRIIEDLLALCRVERGAQEEAIDLARAELRDVLLAAVAECEPRAGERNVAVEVSCPEGLQARMNTQLIEQAVLNLVDNAVKYSQPGGAVTVEAREADGRAVIRVCDRGCGIPARHLSRIFEPFYCVDRSRSRELGGTGLGLAIVQHIVQVHGGAVTVESEVGQGSTFCVNLLL